MEKTYTISEIPAQWTFYTDSFFFQKTYKCKYSINGCGGRKSFENKDDFENEMYRIEWLCSFVNGFNGGDLSFIQGEPKRCLLHNQVSYFVIHGTYPRCSIRFSHDWPLFDMSIEFEGVKYIVRSTRFQPTEKHYELTLRNTVTGKIETKRISMTMSEVNAHCKIIKQSIIKTFQSTKQPFFNFNLDKDALDI